VRAADYWGRAAVLSARPSNSSPIGAAQRALMAGDVDAFATIPRRKLCEFAADPRFAVFAGTTGMKIVLALNHRVPRSATCWCAGQFPMRVDRHAIIDGAMYGYGTPIAAISPRTIRYLDLHGGVFARCAKATGDYWRAGTPRGFATSCEYTP